MHQPKPTRRRRRVRAGALAGIGALAIAAPATAATITVNSLADTTVAGDTQCTLREALANANSDSDTTGNDCAAGSGADTIVFQSGLTGTINLDLGELQISDSVTITGPGASVITISGEQSTNVIAISDGAPSRLDVSISGLTLTQGASGGDGGAIFDDNENLTLDQVVITGNTAFGSGGGIYVNAYYSPAIRITNSTISGNTAMSGDGGGLDVYYALYGSTPSVYLKNDTFTGNSAAYTGGAINVELGTDTGSFTMLNTVVTNNTAGTAQDNAGAGGGVRVQGSGEGGALPITISQSVISGNVADPMDNAAVLGAGNTTNDLGYGGGLYLGGVGGTVSQTTISGNTAYNGGGIYTGDYSNATLENVTITGNQAKNISLAGSGAGVRVAQTVGGNGTILNIDETTITNNTAQAGGGGMEIEAQGTSVTLYDSIVANNNDRDIHGTVTSTYSLIESTSGATILGGTGDITGTDPSLGAPAANGSTVVAGAAGSTQTPQTELPQSGSPVINAGDPAFTPPPAFDERNMPRVVGGRIDMGAVEVQPALSIAPVSQNEGNSGTTPFNFTVTLSATSNQPVSVNYATSDGTAIAGSDYTATSGTLTIPASSTSGTITVNVLGDVVYEPNETFTVTLSTPVNASITTGSAMGTIVNDDPQPALAIDSPSQAEGNSGTTNMPFTVTLSGPSSQTVTVHYATADGSANAGSDYTATSGTLTFNPGVVSQTINVPIIGDTLNEPNETFTVTLTTPSNATIATGTGTGTIVNDDPPPTLAINSPSQAEGNSGTTNMPFTVTLSGPSAQTITVNYATANGTATAGSDYTATSGILTFTPGTTVQTINVPIIGDTVNEANETFTVTLSTPSNATIATGTGTGTILNDDGAPSLSIDSPSQAEGNSGTTNMTFTVTLTPASGQTVTVNYATANGTATAGSDYTATSGTLTFTPGTTVQTINVPILGDTNCEPDETFTMMLSTPSNATIATANGTGTITNDDPCASDLSIAKALNGGPFKVGDNGTYTITVTNGGPSAASGVTVTDVIPAGTQFVSATPSQGTCSGTSTVVCAVGTLNNGGSATIALTVHFTAPGQITNNASVANANGDNNPGNNSAGAAATINAAAAIPTLDPLALALMAALLAFLGIAVTKRS
jgi:uncharacterized repeat protein (TIGR01451 family)/CSLREA domain-containing protein